MKHKLLVTMSMIFLLSWIPLFSRTLEMYITSEGELTRFLEEIPQYTEQNFVAFLEPGVYSVPLFLPPNFSLIGNSPGDTILVGIEDKETVVTLSFNNTIKNVAIHPHDSGNLYAVYARGQKNIHLENVHVSGAQTYGIYLDSCQDVIIQQSVIRDNDYGVFIKGTNKFLIDNSLFLKNGFTAIYLDESEGNVRQNLFAYNQGYGVFFSRTYNYYRRLFAGRRYNFEKNLFFQNGPDGERHLKNLIIEESNVFLKTLPEIDPGTGLIPQLEEINKKYQMNLPVGN